MVQVRTDTKRLTWSLFIYMPSHAYTINNINSQSKGGTRKTSNKRVILNDLRDSRQSR